MPDGVRLSLRLWLPDTTPAPVVWEYIPYRKRDLYRAYDNQWGAVLAQAWIAYARVDVRGTGDSEGVITDEYTELEIADGEHCIRWLAGQSWCNGCVGMRGISWGAINTLQIAARRPAALKAIVPIAGTENRYTDDAHYHGGLLGRANLQWGALFKAVLAGPPDPDVVGEAWRDMWQQRLEATQPVIGNWMRHPVEDEYWSRGTDAARHIACPTYLVAGWQDTYSNPIARLLQNLRCHTKVLIGPWGHTYPHRVSVPGLNWAEEELAWWNKWLHTNPDSDQKNHHAVRAYLSDAWFDATFDNPERLYLHLNADGNLGGEAKTAADLSIPSQLIGSRTPEWLDHPPADQTADDLQSLSFTSRPLDHDLLILGHPNLSMSLVSQISSGALWVRLNDVAPDGSSRLVSQGLVNLIHRQSFKSPQSVPVNEPFMLNLDLRLTGCRINAGHRLRVALSGPPWPMVWPPVSPAILAFQRGTITLPILAATGATDQVKAPSPAEDNATASRFSNDGDTIIYSHDEPRNSYTVMDTGTQLSSSSTQSATINPNDPLSCRWEHHLARSWQRPNWHCEVEVSCTITCTDTHFNVVESLIARFDTQVVFDRTHDCSIPRSRINKV